MSEENEMDKTPGIISWNELASRDIAGSSKFYGELFGWTFQEMDLDGVAYSIILSGERSVGGMLAMPPEAESMPVMWMNYVTVENLETAVARARELGAQICKDITALKFGRFAIARDPQGAVFGLWQFS